MAKFLSDFKILFFFYAKFLIPRSITRNGEIKTKIKIKELKNMLGNMVENRK